jgi:hypothetical protein
MLYTTETLAVQASSGSASERSVSMRKNLVLLISEKDRHRAGISTYI